MRWIKDYYVGDYWNENYTISKTVDNRYNLHLVNAEGTLIGTYDTVNLAKQAAENHFDKGVSLGARLG